MGSPGAHSHWESSAQPEHKLIPICHLWAVSAATSLPSKWHASSFFTCPVSSEHVSSSCIAQCNMLHTECLEVDGTTDHLHSFHWSLTSTCYLHPRAFCTCSTTSSCPEEINRALSTPAISQRGKLVTPGQGWTPAMRGTKSTLGELLRSSQSSSPSFYSLSWTMQIQRHSPTNTVSRQRD